MTDPLRAYAQLRGHGAKGPRYLVRMNKPDGMVIVNATTEPLFAAARVLHSKGITGRLQLWDNVRPYCRLQGDIARLAGMMVSEGDRGICLRPYTERTASGDFEDEPIPPLSEVTGGFASDRILTAEIRSDECASLSLSDSDEHTYTTEGVTNRRPSVNDTQMVAPLRANLTGRATSDGRTVARSEGIPVHDLAGGAA